jgi:hypothetical protein
VTLFGSFLSLFLGYDGGSRGGAIRLSPDKENAPLPLEVVEEEESTPPPSPGGIVSQLKRRVSRRLSDVLAGRVSDGQVTNSPRGGVPMLRTMSKTSKVNGSAYGYSGRLAARLDSATGRRPSLASTLRMRRYTNTEQRPGTPQGFAERLLLGELFIRESVRSVRLSVQQTR